MGNKIVAGKLPLRIALEANRVEGGWQTEEKMVDLFRNNQTNNMDTEKKKKKRAQNLLKSIVYIKMSNKMKNR